MNTHMTAKTQESYQKVSNKVVKKLLQKGTYFPGRRITNQELQTPVKRFQREDKRNFSGGVMNAKWNNIVDNTMVRIAMVVVGFGAWLAIGYGLLAA
jgi:hypothetical protein